MPTVTLTFSYLNNTTLTTNISNSTTYSASTADNTLLTTYDSNAVVASHFSQIISQLQGNTTYVDTNGSSNLIKIYQSLQSILNANVLTTYSGLETKSLSVIYQYYTNVYNTYLNAGKTTQSAYIASNYDPTNQLYTIWKQIMNCRSAFSTISGSTATVNFASITNTTANTALNSLQNIIGIYTNILKKMSNMNDYVNNASTISSSGITINNSNDYFKNGFYIMPALVFTFGTLFGSDITLSTGLITYTQGLVYVATNATIPNNCSVKATTTLLEAPSINSNTIRVASLTNINASSITGTGYYIALDSKYDSSSSGGNISYPWEYLYITSVDSATNTLTLNTSIKKYHVAGCAVQVYTNGSTDDWFAPVTGGTIKAYGIMTTAQNNSSTIYCDYIPNVAVGDYYLTHEYYFPTALNIGSVQVNPGNQNITQITNSQNINSTQSQYRMISIYTPPPNLPISASTQYVVVARLFSNMAANAGSVSVYSTEGSSPTIVSVGAICVVDYGINQEARLITSVTTGSPSFSVNVSNAFSTAHTKFYTPVHIFQVNSNDPGCAWKSGSYGAPYLSTPYNCTYINYTQLVNPVVIGSSILTLSSVTGIQVGNYCSLGYNSNNEYNLRVTSIDSANKTITLHKGFKYAHEANSPVQIYSYPSLPAGSTFTALSTLWQPSSGLQTFSSGTTDIIVNDNTGMSVGDYAMIDTGSSLEYCTITSATNGLYLSVDILKNNHSNKIPVQTFSYPVKVPSNALLKNIVTTTNSLSIGGTTINVSSSTNLAIGNVMYVDPAGSNCEITQILAISGTTCTVAPLKYAHSSGTVCIAFNFYRTPNNSVYKNWTYLNASASNPNTVITVKDVSNIAVGDFLQLDATASLIEVTKVVSVNVATKQVTISNPLMFSHTTNCVVQIFNMNIPSIPSDGTILGMSYIYSNLNVGGAAASVYNSNINLTNAKFMIYTPSTSTETGFITNITGGNTVSISTSVISAHYAYDLVVFYTHPITFPASVFNKNITTIVASPISAGSNTIVVENVQNIVANNVIAIMNGTTQEYRLITNISGNTLTVSPSFTTAVTQGKGIAVGSIGRLGVSGTTQPAKDDYPLLSSSNQFLGYYYTASSVSAGSYIYTVDDTSKFQIGNYIGFARRVNNNSQPVGMQQIIGINNTNKQIICFPQMNSGGDTYFTLFKDTSLSILQPNTFSFFTTLVSNITSGSTTCVIPYGGPGSFSKNASNCNYTPLPNAPNGGTTAIWTNDVRIIVGAEDKLVTAYNGGTGVITVDTPFSNNYESGYPSGTSVVGYYPQRENSIPSPTTNVFKTQCFLLANSPVGQNTLTVNTVAGIEIGYSVSYYSILTTANSGVTNQTVTAIDSVNNIITLSTTNTQAHVFYDLVLFYVTPPSVPAGSTKTVQTKVSTAVSSGSNTLTVSSLTSITVGSYLLIGYGSKTEQNLKVNSINSSTNTITLDSSFINSYSVKDPCQFYTYPALQTAGATLLHRSAFASTMTSGTKIATMIDASGFNVGDNVQLNYGSTFNYNTIASISGNTVTLTNNTSRMYDTTSIMQSYIASAPTLPTDATIISSTVTAASHSIGTTTISVTYPNSAIPNGSYAYIGNSLSTVDNILITSVNITNKTITLQTGLTYAHTSGELVQIYKYPDIPTGGSLLTVSNFTTASAVGDTTIYVTSTQGILSDVSYIMTGSGSSIDQNIKISSFTSNSITLSSPLLYSHAVGSLLQVYKYPNLPTDAVSIGLSFLNSDISAGTTTLQVTSTNGIFPGNTGVQLGYGSSLEYGYIVTAVNGNTITLSSPVQYSRASGTVLQLYTFVEMPSGTTFISLSTIQSNISAGSTTLSVASTANIVAGTTYMAIGSGGMYESDLLITEINSNVLTINGSLQYARVSGLPIIFYSYPTLPSQASLKNIKRINATASIGQTTLTLNNVTSIIVGDYIHIGTGSSARSKLITSISGNVVTLDSAIAFNYSVNYPVQVYSYAIPALPSQGYAHVATRLSGAKSAGSSTIDVVSSYGIYVGHRVLLDVAGWIETKIVISISGNTLTLSSPLTYDHINYSLVQPFYYILPSLPTGSIELPRVLSTTSSSVDGITLTLSSLSDAIVGNFLLIDAGSSVETKLITSVSGNVVTLDSSLQYSHDAYTTIQVYSIPSPTLPTYAILTSAVSSRLSSKALEASTQITISTTITEITHGCYAYIDVGTSSEICLITSVSGNTITFELPTLKEHRNGSLVQFFAPKIPSGSILVDNSNIYQLIQTNKTSNNGLLSQEGSNDTLLSTFQGFVTQLTAMPGTLYSDVVILLTPIINIISSKCLYALNTYTTLSVYIPYFNKLILRSSSLTNINNYDLRPNVYALWDLLALMRDTYIPHLLNNSVTNTDELVACIQMFYNIYDQLHLLRVGLDAYLNKNGITGYNGETNLNNSNFPSIPNTTYSNGLMVGAAINSINEAGTVYPITPVLNSNQIITTVTSSTTPTTSGSIKIDVPPNTDVKLQQQVVIDIGLAQEIRTVVGYGSLIFNTPLDYPHPAGVQISAFDTATYVEFVVPEFHSEFRLTQDILTNEYVPQVPIATFTASGTISLDLLKKTFLIGTNDVDAFVTSIGLNLLTGESSERVAYYVDSQYWNDSNYSSPKVNLAQLTCSPNYYMPSTFISRPTPVLADLQTSTLCYYAFGIKDSAVLVKNQKSVANNITQLFSQYIWNNTYGTMLWTQDYRRVSTDTLSVQQSQDGPLVNYGPNEDLKPDPDNANVQFIPDNNSAGSLTKRLFYQLARTDLERLRNLEPHPTLKDVYYFPFIAGDTIIFKVNMPYSNNNILALFNIGSGGNLTQHLSELNDRFNLAVNEHTDYNSYTIHLTVV
jgi:hypothetical protein